VNTYIINFEYKTTYIQSTRIEVITCRFSQVFVHEHMYLYRISQAFACIHSYKHTHTLTLTFLNSYWHFYHFIRIHTYNNQLFINQLNVPTIKLALLKYVWPSLGISVIHSLSILDQFT
jgi:hypothetical protein